MKNPSTLPNNEPTEAEADQPLGASSLALKILAILGIASALVWIGAILIGPTIVPPGRLDDRTFPSAAEPRCALAVEQHAALPTARDIETPQERAEVVDQSADIFGAMTIDLRAAVPSGPDAKFINEWLDDWERHVSDRRDFAQRLRTGGQDERFLESTRDDTQISNPVNRYAEINDMASCVIPGDL